MKRTGERILLFLNIMRTKTFGFCYTENMNKERMSKMAKRPLTPRESELVVTALFVVDIVPYNGHIDRLESLTLRDIADDYINGTMTKEAAIDALDQYIFVRRHRFRNVTPNNLWTLDDRTELEALRYIERRPELAKGQTMNKRQVPFAVGEDVSFKVEKQVSRGAGSLLIGKQNGYTLKAQAEIKDPVHQVEGWITNIDRKEKVVFVSVTLFGKEDIPPELIERFEDAAAAMRAWFATATIPTQEQAQTTKQFLNTLIRRDEEYWFTLYEAFGLPRTEHMKRWMTVVNLLAKASTGDEHAIRTLETQEDRYFKDAFLRALRQFTEK